MPLSKWSMDKPDDVVVQEMKWGLIPSFVKNAIEQASSSTNKFATTNARAESLFESKAYRESVEKGYRCIIVSQG